ncbi:MAG: hypothetical protein K6A92_04630 [Lachnospiraceae bacterium]|nr:hypothetical protein [Lachnospiraceae bacterium]
MHKDHGIWFRIKAYHLHTQVYVTCLMVFIFVVSIVVYCIPAVRQSEVLSNLMLALFTSLLVTVFTTIADLYISYKNHRSEEYLEDMHQYGIASLHRDKKRALQNMLSDCDKSIWISGYRLILTRDLIPDIEAAIGRGARVKAVICPPWNEAYGMVYGDSGKVMDNYFTVFHAIYRACMEHGFSPAEFQVYFINKPIFSDTYRVDQNLITGPYMHNRDREFKRLMAKDFFSYDIVRQSSLYAAVNDEFATLCDEAEEILDWSLMEELYQRFEKEDWTEAQKRDEFHKMCKKIK